MAEKKITKREKNELIIAVLGGERTLTDEERKMLIEHMTHEIELLARKNSKSATATPAQKDAVAIAEIVKDILAEATDPKGMTVGAILKDERIKSYVRHNGDTVSSQVVTAILSKSVVSDTNPNGEYVRTVEKKVAYYSLAYGEVADEGEGD